MQVTTYIQPETDAALSKLGGATRAENIRRAVALAEVAKVARGLAGALEDLLQLIETERPDWDHAEQKIASHALNQYEAAKNVN